MSHYHGNLRDIEFNLYEVFRTQDWLGTDTFPVDADTARMMLAEFARFTGEGPWADSFVPADRTPLHLDADGDVTIPDELHAALEAFHDDQWHLLSLSTELGGMGTTPTLRWAAYELMSGAHAAATLWFMGPLFGQVLSDEGTPAQYDRFGQHMVHDRWGATMVLTEPDAGSDVGAGVTKAVKVAEDDGSGLGSTWHLTGVKRFITSADAQTHANTVHLVLARPEGGEPGTKGLRLFIVPKFHVLDDEGTLGERNGVKVTNLEDKMGIKASATCELTFGADPDRPAVGYLVGERDGHGDGIAQMFRIIEHARMSIGVKAMSTLSTGYLNALEYAKVRVQGADLTRMADKTAPKVTIINHPDVRRLLMDQKVHAEGMRALCTYAGVMQDQAMLADGEERDAWERRNDLLLPLVKGYCSEKAYELLADSLQVFGGSGFTRDYPIEQYIRDAKIDTLYEGTTAIQSLDLVFRKIARDNAQTLFWFAGQVKETVDTGRDEFADERKALGQALEDVQGHLGHMLGWAMAARDDAAQAGELYKTGLHTVSMLESLSELLIGWLLLRQAEVAHDALAADGGAGRDTDFYTGKVASARYWARTVLPKTRHRREQAMAEDGSLMELPEGAF
ncbi:acyl-CoA dehydrogenase [Salsipaludibacter albus]|uniref:acyl-CoA dehydrogenase n=1 Tax=Salsipaludibacter albus TaxID=2849650 RepID=UPI001EE4221F|nr:acyl-CoA dehydrogenase [Salsipaludibacter albus]MBY5163882.1 acyl-CoA dehydrogenase [Salsipaludibacter albus]